jgi:hypothetical protein
MVAAQFALKEIKYQIGVAAVELAWVDEDLPKHQLIKSINSLKPDFILGFTRSEKLIQVFENTLYPILNTGASPGGLCNPLKLLSFVPSEELRSAATQRLGYGSTKPIVVATRNSSGASSLKSLSHLDVIWVPPNLPTYSKVFRQILAQGNDTVYVVMPKHDAARFLTTAKQHPLLKPHYIVGDNHFPIAWDKLKVADTYASDSISPRLNSIRNDMFVENGYFPNAEAIRMIDAINLLAESPEQTMDLLSKANFTSASGLTKFVGGIGVYDFYEIKNTDGQASEVLQGNLLTRGIEPKECK